MLRIIQILLLLTTFILSCRETGKKGNVSFNDSSKTTTDSLLTKSFAYRYEQEYLQRKRVLSNKLALYDLEKGTADYELRLWRLSSMWDPSILYILKANDTTWTLFHYQFYTLRSTHPNHYYDNPNVDSVVMTSVKPQTTKWRDYINNLQLDSLWNLQTESMIKDKNFGISDGHKYLLEISNKKHYKYLYYKEPEYFKSKDINPKKFAEFIKHLVDPIIYNGMHNP